MCSVVQQNLFEASVVGLKRFKQKRVHLKNVTYTKSYQIYHYNEDTGEWVHDSDEPHILHIKTLHNIHYALYVLIKFRIINKNEDIADIVLHPEDEQAEIKDMWNLSIKDRLLIHIEFLRQLRKGKMIKEAVWLAKRKAKTIL